MSLRSPAARRYRGLADARTRRELGLAAAEGVRLVREAVAAGAALADVFVAPRLARSPEGASLLAELEAGQGRAAWALHRVGDALLERLAFTEHPQGVVASFRPRAHRVEDALAGRGPLVMLDGVADPGNLGLIVRTAEAAGASGIALSPGSVDALNPKAVRASAGSVFRLPLVRAPIEVVLACAAADDRPVFATAPRGGELYTAADLSGRLALLLGTEGAGLPDALRARFRVLRIPTGGVESLNVAMAAGVLLYEALRQRAGA